MIHIAIVENETSQIDMTKKMIQDYFQKETRSYEIKSFLSGFDFLEADTYLFDIIFMDIDMPGINGMETAERIRKKGLKTPLIFVTNLPQYAIDGYKVEAIDFILKPMTNADFSMAMNRAMNMLKKDEIGEFVLTIHGTLTKFKANDILYIDMVKHDVNIHMTQGDVITFRSSLSRVEPLLDDRIFLKCNSGCIANINKIKMMNPDTLTMENGDHLSISRSRKKPTLEKLNEFYSLIETKNE